jgi:hypothetical protein
VGYLEALLSCELEERGKNTVECRIREERLSKVKTTEEFDYSKAPTMSAAQMRGLAEGGYIARAEPVLFIWGLWNGKDASVEWFVRGRLPAKTAGAVHDGVGVGQ